MSTQSRWRVKAGLEYPGPWRDMMSEAILDALEAGYSGAPDQIELRARTEYSTEQSGEQISSPTLPQPLGADAPTRSA